MSTTAAVPGVPYAGSNRREARGERARVRDGIEAFQSFEPFNLSLRLISLWLRFCYAPFKTLSR